MKKLICTVISIIMTVSMMMPVWAEEVVDNFVNDIGEIDCPKGTPGIDGAISAGEGWSGAQYFDKTNTDGAWGGEEVRISGNIYRAYDDTNLYIAADINMPELTPCTGEDDIDSEDIGNKPGWNGDVFAFSVDPNQVMLYAGMLKDAAPWYCFGIFEDESVRVYKTHTGDDKEVSTDVKAAGAVTPAGWRFEAAIPWQMICEDVERASMGDAVINPEDILGGNGKVSSAMIYYDRGIDPDSGNLITYSRYVTIAKVLPDGSDGTQSSAWILSAHGMHLMMGGAGASGNGAVDTPDNSGNGQGGADNGGNAPTDGAAGQSGAPADNQGGVQNGVSGQNQSGANNSTVKGNSAVTTKAQSNSGSTGGSAAQTFDMGIAAAIGALAISGIGLYIVKKRR